MFYFPISLFFLAAVFTWEFWVLDMPVFQSDRLNTTFKFKKLRSE